ncbi:REP-associated tyrosine transposase [Solitalea longa]|uniref:REP-associated tyrosine transposase n=1 Tax=Solitalea longa TaxID=2079460 RepID=UPI002936DE68|nr:transposase [Solitalea longa]
MYFITFSVVEWVDVFSRSLYADIVIESLCYCQQYKGLVIYAYCIMSNHVHLIVSRSGEQTLSEILQDFKKYTAVKILKEIDHVAESRKSWFLWIFKSTGKRNSNNKVYQFWQQDNHPEELISNQFMDQKLDYLHNNPVVAGIVDEPEHYRYSRARNYAGQKGLLAVAFLE